MARGPDPQGEWAYTTDAPDLRGQLSPARDRSVRLYPHKASATAGVRIMYSKRNDVESENGCSAK